MEEAYNLNLHDPIKDELAEKIISQMPDGTVPVHISIIGSRAKGYNMDDSDYQIRIISMSSQDVYDVGNEKKTFGIRTSFKGRTVDCIGVDLKLSLDWA